MRVQCSDIVAGYHGDFGHDLMTSHSTFILYSAIITITKIQLLLLLLFIANQCILQLLLFNAIQCILQLLLLMLLIAIQCILQLLLLLTINAIYCYSMYSTITAITHN